MPHLTERKAESKSNEATVDIREPKCGEGVSIDVLQDARRRLTVPSCVLRAIRGVSVSPLLDEK